MLAECHPFCRWSISSPLSSCLSSVFACAFWKSWPLANFTAGTSFWFSLERRLDWLFWQLPWLNRTKQLDWRHCLLFASSWSCWSAWWRLTGPSQFTWRKRASRGLLLRQLVHHCHSWMRTAALVAPGQRKSCGTLQSPSLRTLPASLSSSTLLASSCSTSASAPQYYRSSSWSCEHTMAYQGIQRSSRGQRASWWTVSWVETSADWGNVGPAWCCSIIPRRRNQYNPSPAPSSDPYTLYNSPTKDPPRHSSKSHWSWILCSKCLFWDVLVSAVTRIYIIIYSSRS